MIRRIAQGADQGGGPVAGLPLGAFDGPSTGHRQLEVVLGAGLQPSCDALLKRLVGGVGTGGRAADALGETVELRRVPVGALPRLGGLVLEPPGVQLGSTYDGGVGRQSGADPVVGVPGPGEILVQLSGVSGECGRGGALPVEVLREPEQLLRVGAQILRAPLAIMGDSVDRVRITGSGVEPEGGERVGRHGGVARIVALQYTPRVTTFSVQTEELRRLAANLGTFHRQLHDVSAALSSLGETQTGHDAVASAVAGFVDHWRYALGKIDEHARSVESRLHQAAETYQAADDGVARASGG